MMNKHNHHSIFIVSIGMIITTIVGIPRTADSFLFSTNVVQRDAIIPYHQLKSHTLLYSYTKKDGDDISKNEGREIVDEDEVQSTSSSDTTSGWELEEDWTLQDQVPLFTVQSSTIQDFHKFNGGRIRQQNHSVTFWTQLKHSTPLLSYRTEEELEQRYRMLSEEQACQIRKQENESSDDGNVVNSKKKKKIMMPCGKSPQILTDWWMDNHSSSATGGEGGIMMMGGTLMNGRKILFPLHHAGTILGSTKFSDHVEMYSNTENEHPRDDYNYAEAIGGCIYELGRPRTQSIDISSTPRSSRPSSLSDEKENSQSAVIPWMSSRNGSIFSIVTAFMLSAVIAFSSDPLHSHVAAANTVTQSPDQTVIVVSPKISEQIAKSTQNGGSLLGPPSSSMISSSSTEAAAAIDKNDLSIGAQRARQELKVERDKLTISRVQERLKMDESRLKELQREESRQEAVKYGFAKEK